jgi:tetratricopeptide (TPR) repeat protein
MALLALVSAGVNFRWWRQHARSASGVGRQALGVGRWALGPDAQRPTPLMLQVEQQRRWVAAHPEDDATRMALARLLFITRRFPEAEAQLLLLERRQPKRAEIGYWLSLVQKQNGQLDAALRSIQRARRLDPHREIFFEGLGEIYLAQGRSEEAASTFDACLKQRPDSYAALMGKARAMEQLYEAKLPVAIPEIVTPVRKAVQLQPRNPWGVTVLARMSFAYLQQFETAERLANQAIQLDPRQVEPYLILVEIYLDNPTPDSAAKAVACARQAARLDPRNPQPIYLLGRALLRQNDLPGAIAAFEQSTHIQLMPEAVYQLSLAYARAGHLEQARHYSRLYDSWSQFTERRKLLLALLQHRPQDIRLHAQLAELYLAQGAIEPARNWLRKGLQLRPQDPTLRSLLARVEKQQERVDTKTQRHEGREAEGRLRRS